MRLNKIKSYAVNPLDMCILIVALSVIIGGFYNLFNNNLFLLMNPTENAVISITINTYGDYEADDFKSGEKIYLQSSGHLIGQISDTKNVKEKIYSSINNTLLYDYSEKNIAVIVEIDAKIKRNGNLKYIDNSIPISAGTVLDVRIDNLGEFSGQIDSVMIK